MTVLNGIIYSAGHDIISGIQCACLWMNDKEFPLLYTDSEARSIFVDQNNLDIYISGSLSPSTTPTPVYWKNKGAPIVLDNPAANSTGNSIYLSNGNIFIGGVNSTGSGYWKNGSFNILPNATFIDSILINNDDVYSFGQSSSGCSYWKNQNETPISNFSITTLLYSNFIFINNRDIYITGYNSSTGLAIYYVNGTTINLISPSSDIGSAGISIFVKDKS
jgi:hypothetical protein